MTNINYTGLADNYMESSDNGSFYGNQSSHIGLIVYDQICSLKTIYLPLHECHRNVFYPVGSRD